MGGKKGLKFYFSTLKGTWNPILVALNDSSRQTPQIFFSLATAVACSDLVT